MTGEGKEELAKPQRPESLVREIQDAVARASGRGHGGSLRGESEASATTTLAPAGTSGEFQQQYARLLIHGMTFRKHRRRGEPAYVSARMY